jgi:ABC-type branched-subunit amino acid transport system substrate-binding protein
MLVAAGCGARLDDRQLAQAKGKGVGLTASRGGDAGSDAALAASGGSTAGGGGTSPGGGSAGGAGGAGGKGGAGAITAKAPAGGNGGATDVGVTGDSINLGNVSLLTGPVPGLFQGAVRGTQAFFAYQNSQGGVYGRKLNLQVRDDGFDVNQNKAQHEDLLGSVLAFVGSFSVVDDGGALVLGAHPDVPDISQALGHNHFALPNNFSIAPIAPGWRLGSLNYFKAKFGPQVVEHMAMFAEDAGEAKDAAKGEQKAAESLGYKFVYSRVFEPTEANYSSDVVNMQGAGVKGIFMAGEVGAMARMAKAMKQQGFSVPFANWGGNAYDPTFVTPDAAPATNGSILDLQLAMFAGEDAGNVPEVALFLKWLKQVAPGQHPDLFAAYGWESARLFVQALAAAGPRATRAGLLAELKKIDNFDGNGMLAPAGPASKRPPTCFITIQVTNGKFTRADPPTGFICDKGGYFHLS